MKKHQWEEVQYRNWPNLIFTRCKICGAKWECMQDRLSECIDPQEEETKLIRNENLDKR